MLLVVLGDDIALVTNVNSDNVVPLDFCTKFFVVFNIVERIEKISGEKIKISREKILFSMLENLFSRDEKSSAGFVSAIGVFLCL